MIRHQHIRCPNHLGRDVGMQIKRCHDRHTRADAISQLFQDFAFDIRMLLGNHGSVQSEQIRVNRASRFDRFEELFVQPAETLCRRRSAGPSRQSNEPRDLWRFRPSPHSLNEPTQLIHFRHLFDQINAATNAELLKVRLRRGDRIQGVRLLPELADGDTHGFRIAECGMRNERGV